MKLTFSTNRFPLNSAFQAGLLFGGCLQPFTFSSTNRPIQEEEGGNLRCFACGGYWWPNCSWRGRDTWICALCGAESTLDMQRKPKPEEMRDFTVLYEDNSSQRDICMFFIIDGTSEESFVDSSLLSMVAAVQHTIREMPTNVRFGFAVSLYESLAIVQYIGDRFLVAASRINSNAVQFRVDIADCTTPRKCTTTNRELFLRALSSAKAIIRSQTNNVAAAAAPTVFGRCVTSMLHFFGPCAGAHVFAFSEHCKLSTQCQRAVRDFVQVNLNGLDFLTAGVAEQDVDQCLLDLVRTSGGRVTSVQFASKQQELQQALLARFQTPLVFRGMVRARTLPELTVALPRRSAPSTATAAAAEEQGAEWWIVTILKRVLHSVISPRASSTSAVAVVASSLLAIPSVATAAATASSSCFLGSGHHSTQDGLWIVPSCAQDMALGFELDFADQVMGMESFAYPRSMAVQVASSFVTLEGKRFTRVESRSCEGTDTPARSAQETWKWCDLPTLVFLLVRLLVYSFDKDEYADVVVDWAARALAQRGLLQDRFERKLAKQLFGWLRAPECGQSLRSDTCCAVDLNPIELERYLWPMLFRSDLPNNALPLNLQALQSNNNMQCSYVMDAVSHVFCLRGEDQDQAARAEARAKEIAETTRRIAARVVVLELEKVLDNNTMQTAVASPFAKSTEEANKDLFLSLLYEEGVEFTAFVTNCVERSKVVTL